MSATRGTELAVVGLAGEFPGADSVDELWRRVRAGEECLTFFDEEELLRAGVERERLRSPDYVRARGTLNRAEEFDAALFGIAPSEAQWMDPQQRRFLQVAWSALEHAGYCAGSGLRVGVFAGAGTNTHLWRLGVPLDPDSAEAWRATLWNDNDFLATRVSYKLNLHGPAATVQTACSTSLVSTIMAAQNLLAGDCDLAVAGGAAIKTPQARGYFYTKGGILSPDGHCRPFDIRSAGTVPANGVAAIVLKRLDDAIADRDTIHAVLTGYGLNNDGSGKVSYHAPSAAGQAAAIREALRTAEIDPGDIGYIEAHGTGTALGDAIEVAALSQVFAKSGGGIGLGSIKSNVGHLDIASGITGLIKACLTVRDGQFPPTVHFRQSNPELHLDESPFTVCDRMRPWTGSSRRMAGVSSFGIGGTNAHVIVEEPPRRPPVRPTTEPEVVLLSGRTAEAVAGLREALASHLVAHPDTPIADVAFTLAEGRSHMNVRKVLVANDRDELIDLLTEPEEPAEPKEPVDAASNLVFMYPGGGTLRAGMAAALYQGDPVFRAQLDRCVARFSPPTRAPVRRLLLEDTPHEPRFGITLQAIFAFEHALTGTLREHGIEPTAVIGHSLGEYAAAVTAGIFDLADAAAAVEARSAVLEAAGGGMLSVALPAAEVRTELPAGLSVAAVNTSEFTVVSGHIDDIAAYRQDLIARGVEVRDVPIPAAAHSALLEPGLPGFRERIAALRTGRAVLPFVSGLTGTWAAPDLLADREYWVRQLREPVEFAAGLDALLAMTPAPILIEVGPGRDLSSPAGRRAGGRERIVTVCPGDGPGDFARALGRLWELGVEVRWSESRKNERGRVPLPTYPFARNVYTLDGQPPPQMATKATPPERWFYTPSWQSSVIPTGSARGTRRVIGERLRDIQSESESGKCPDAVVVDGDAPDAAWELLSCVQELDRLAPKAIRLVVVGSGLHDIDGTERLHPERRALIGLCLSLGQELDWCDWTVIDALREEWSRAVEAELSAAKVDRLVAYRRGRRLTQVLTRLELPQATGSFEPDKAYLITGGSGHVGGLLVDHLTDRVGANVVVLSRGGLAGKWSDNSRVCLVAGDVAEEADVRKAVALADERFGRLDGVVHLAGVVSGRSVPRQALHLDRSDLREQLRPKADGAAVLATVLADRRLDFVALFSSNAAVLGGLGLGAYAAANAVLDGVAAEQGRRTAAAANAVQDGVAAEQGRRRTRWLSLAWDGWGTAADGVERGSGLDAFALTAAEAIDALDRALRVDGLSCLAVSRGDLVERARLWVELRGRTTSKDPVVQQAETDEDPMVRRLIGLWGEVLGAACGPTTNFFDAGGHSLLALRLLRRVEEATGRLLPANAIAHAPTPRRLAPLIAEPGSVDIVELAAHSGPPLLLIHPQGGGVLCYAALAQGLGLRVLACDDQRLAVDDPPRESISELAARYLTRLRREVPHGPYRVGGWSFGGVVAFEVARLLKQAGEDVRLVMIDSPAPNGQALPRSGAEELAATIVWNWLRQAGVHPAESYPEFLALPGELRFRVAAEAAAAAGMASLVRAMESTGAGDLLRRTVAVGAHHSDELDAYRPEPCAIDALLLRATAQHNGPLADLPTGRDDLGWRSLIPSITVIDVAGDHASVLAQPQVREVTTAIRRWLR
ncbi:MAG TPA: SDR family oxidoreductase [Candidatus Limnocylindrales bacterium]|nr:SDR family oxidoreductase [Candidatus Limnocylindrales bacterium]